MGLLTHRSSITAAMVQFFREDDWQFEETEIGGDKILTFGFQGETESWRCLAQARDEREQFVFYSQLPQRVPPEKRAVVAEYLTRATYGLYLGNFEMDFNDGEVRFKTSVDVEGGELAQTMIRTVVYTNVLMVNKYLPGLMSVMYGSVAPADAVATAEN